MTGSPVRIITVTASRAIAAVLALLVLTTALGAALGTPMGVSYVETNSMKPTLHPGDGFILVPDELTGPPEKGDVIVFRAEEVRGGGLTTHRVVGKTDRGYITQGDNNNAPDQVAGEPPVQQAQIVGQPLQFGGQVVVIPGVGTAATTTSGIVEDVRRWYNTALLWLGLSEISSSQFSYIVTGLLIVLYGAESLRARGRNRDRKASERYQRKTTRGDEDAYTYHTILLVLTGVLILAMTTAMILPGGPEKYGVVASKSDSPVFVDPGSEQEFKHGIGNSPFLPMAVFLEGGDSVNVSREKVKLQRGGVSNVSATVSVPPSVGYHRFYVVEHWYIPVLPMDILTALYQLHPWLPIAAIDVVVAAPYYLIGRYIVVTRAPPRARSRTRSRFS